MWQQQKFKLERRMLANVFKTIFTSFRLVSVRRAESHQLHLRVFSLLESGEP